MNPIDKYNSRVDRVNSLLCVGLDPDFEKLPAKFKAVGNSQFEFNKWIIEQTSEYAAAYKPNIAFYEARGGAGIKELKMTIDYIRENHPDVFTIVDIKRGDIGNTNAVYAKTYYDYFGFDAVTMHPYMGGEPLKPFLERTDKAVIILCRTSNPGAPEFQDLIITPHPTSPTRGEENPKKDSLPLVGREREGAKPLWQIVAEHVRDNWNTNHNCMLMIGATYPEELKKARALLPNMTILIAGIGAQQGEVEATIRAGIDSQGRGLICNASRSIIFAENPAGEARKLRDEINKYRV